MLVINRKLGESVAISGEIQVRVLRISPSRVLLGITSGPGTRVLRQEILAHTAAAGRHEAAQAAVRAQQSVPPHIAGDRAASSRTGT